MCFLDHFFGQEMSVEGVEDDCLSSTVDMSIDDHFVSSVRLVYFHRAMRDRAWILNLRRRMRYGESNGQNALQSNRREWNSREGSVRKRDCSGMGSLVGT